MKIRKIAAVAVLVLSSFAANDVAPSKAELEGMYDKAFRDFDANNFPEALKQLDAIDARQPDVAESQNLRGVIFMREGIYDKAEAALHEALRIDPKFWNARFNLAEVPFLKKDWPEARNRFQDLLSNNVSELQGEAAQLIQYKILLTYLLEGKENMVDSILAKFELSPETPAVHYANAAIALQHKNSKEAKDWMAAAEKNFSPQLNKLFAESLYEVGWLQKQAGQSRAALEINTPEERQAKLKTFARSRFEEAQQAFQQRDLDTARKFVEEADDADPNQPSILTLRGEILMEQKDFDQAEVMFKKAAKIDPKFREAQFNLAQIPFKKKDYAKARDRFEALFNQTPGGDKNQAAQMIKFKIFMTFLLEGKDSRAQKLMEQFQFTGDTPALYYAQAAWEFKHNNPNKANDWIASAKKIYSSALNGVFADAFYDLGWLQSPATGGSPGPATEAATVMSAQTESSPAIEPSPIPGTTVASSKQTKEQAKQKVETTLALAQPAPSPVTSGLGTTAASSLQPPVSNAPSGSASTKESIAAGSPAMPSDIPAVASPSLSPTVETAVVAASPSASVVASAGLAEKAEVQGSPTALTDRTASATPSIKAPAIASASATPATALAPPHIAEPARHGFGETLRHLFDPRALVVVALILGALAVVAFWPDMRRRFGNVQMYRAPVPAAGPRFAQRNGNGSANGNGSGNGNGSATSGTATKSRLSGGPRHVSLQLKASEPSLRRSVRPIGKPVRAVGSAPPIVVEGDEEAVTVPQVTEIEHKVVEPVESVEQAPEPQYEFSPPSDAVESVGPVIEQGAPAPVFAETAFAPEASAAEANVAEAPSVEPVSDFAPAEEWAAGTEPAEIDGGPHAEAPEAVSEPPVSAEVSGPAESESEFEPIEQGQPVPYQMSPSDDEFAVAKPAVPDIEEDYYDEEPVEIAAKKPVTKFDELSKPSIEIPSLVPAPRVSTEPSVLQPTTPVIMPEPIQIPTAPMIRTPSSAGSPQPASAMQTAVQLTFSFEIASMQLTPTFKMGALQLRPTSKIVTMRLAPSQQPQPAMNLQVTFEVSKIQPAGGGLGTVRLTPSQAQRPSLTGSPSFTVGGLQLISNFEAAPVQLTPSQQASVLVTSAFQIATVEFSPSFDIASIVLNASSKQVAVQLAGTGSIENAPMFEIANLQLGASGEIGIMQLNLLGQGPRRG